MSHKSIFIYTLVFICLTAFGSLLALKAFSNLNLQSLIAGTNSQSVKTITPISSQCTAAEPIAGLANSGDVHLAKLDEYQAVCKSQVGQEFMIFTNMPKDNVEAAAMAKEMAAKLRTFDQYNVTPLVIIEPSTTWGLIDFSEFKNGLYSEWIQQYFQNLKNEGITNQQMGIWTPFPEPNAPLWNRQNFVPEDFSVMVNIYAESLKTYFPTTHVSLLFNSTSYDSNDEEYANGEYLSFEPWISQIKPGLIDSFGIQGFPWLPRATTKGSGITDANEFLNPRLLLEAASILKVKDVWFNTGTFYSKYTNDSSNTVIVSPSQRKSIANSIVATVSRVQSQGYNVMVNIFAEDKSETAEATDWSYWQSAKQSNNANRVVFIDFVHALAANNVKISIFDKADLLTERN